MKATKSTKKIESGLQDLAFQPTNPPSNLRQLAAAVNKKLQEDKSKKDAAGKPASTLNGVQLIFKKHAKTPLEELEPNPGQEKLNLQLALTRLTTDVDERTLARKNGAAFQLKYNLTNEQMWTLCRIAFEIGAYKNTDDLKEYLEAFVGMDPVLKALSPDAAERLKIKDPDGNGGGIIGSCSCCCR